MKTRNASAIVTTLVYAQGLLVIAAVAAVIMRLPADEQKVASTDQPVVAALAVDTVSR